MDWKDILKNVITQGRVKEIEDIDIDIEDDDCLRWLKKLYDIIARHPESKFYRDQVENEEGACAIKEAFTKGRNPNTFRNNNDLPSNSYTNYIDGATVVFSVSVFDKDVRNIKGTMGQRLIVLYSLYYGGGKEGAKILTIVTSREKASKITKEICAYLNISYDKMARGVL